MRVARTPVPPSGIGEAKPCLFPLTTNQERTQNEMNNQITIKITYKDILAQAEEEGIPLTTKRAKELVKEWARSMQETLTTTANELISDCVLPDAQEESK